MADMEKREEKATLTPWLDIIEREHGYEVFVDFPGVKSENLDLNLEGNTLTLRAHTESEKTEDLPLLYREYVSGDYETTLRITDKVDRDKIEAEIKDGVLFLKLPKREEVAPRQIKIKAA